MEKATTTTGRLLEKRTPWVSIWTTSAMMCFTGIQTSVYFTSTWQYIRTVHPEPTIELFSYVVASTSLGCAIANPIFGYWNQKTMSTKKPLTVGFMLSAIGNLLYALLPVLPIWSLSVAPVIARFLEGFGAGTSGILRSFLGTASTSKDRVRAVSLGTSGLTAGLSLGPVLQICFLPVEGMALKLGPLVFNPYSSVAYFMFFLSCLGMILTNVLIKENYAGIITDEEKKTDPYLVIPSFDRLPVAILFFYWWTFWGISATEGMASPITMAMFHWTNEQAVFYNGVIQIVSCVTSTVVYITIGCTNFGDRRRHLLLGFTGLLCFHLVHLPWPFYPQSLGQSEDTCPYHWCSYTPRVPKYLYLFMASIMMGVSYPLLAAPCNTLLSEVLGPRKQGLIMGVYAFAGSISQFSFPLFASPVFAATGYGLIMSWHVLMVSIAIALLIIFHGRLVPLQLEPPIGVATKYKKGTFYRF